MYPAKNSISLLARFLGLHGYFDFVILANINGEKVDFFLARMDFLASYNDFLVLLNVSGEKVDSFFAKKFCLSM